MIDTNCRFGGGSPIEGIELYAKLEFFNGVGSIKDRPAFWILKRAIERGEVVDQTTIIESPSGNFACALFGFFHDLDRLPRRAGASSIKSKREGPEGFAW